MRLENKIDSILLQAPHGLRAKEIAKNIIGADRSEINSFLYDHLEKYKMIEDYRWVLISTNGLSDTDDFVLRKMQNANNAILCDPDEFYSLADWTHGETLSSHKPVATYRTRSGNLIDCDSKSELMLLEYLEENDLIIDIGGQSLCIHYSSSFRDDLNYYPDIVALTKYGHIVIFEVKPITAMSNHKNIEKYKALSAFCEENGYAYMMVDPARDFMTFNDLENMTIPVDIIKRVDSYLVNIYGTEDALLLEPEDIPELYSGFSRIYKKKDFELYLHALIIRRGWHNKFKNGFMVYENPQR